ncbi:FAD-binding oxidoreductase [Renibacterium salmoninarum]|uniref:FAD-binding oxidoreductase n=1 Tax=Renibacterium salmoninarum TaxID=1646 RepID=UPI001F2473DE|nr:FAD-binding oxidoreductase [Renibacterium salmoninarum]
MKVWLDGQLGRLTMYRLVLFALGILAVYSMILQLLGWLTFGLGAMLLSLLVCLLVTWLSSRLLALIFGVKIQTESSLITGLLLYFLFTPTLELGPLLGIALAAAIAGASKFLLAYRGRHIFNPAAIGALLVALIGPDFVGLNLASWWVAASSMLWLVVPAGLIVLYRSSKLIFATIFILLSVSVIFLRSTATLDPIAALASPLGSYPVLFFIGFMLCEPLTLPPRRWQKWGLAAVVALLFSVPFSLGPVFSSPELALVLGNFLAFAFGQRRKLQLKLSSSRTLTPSSREFSFTVPKPVRFQAGQYLELTLPHSRVDGRGIRRVFSITTDPHDGGNLAIALRFSEPSSSFKTALGALESGQPISATGVWGDFVIPRGNTAYYSLPLA